MALLLLKSGTSTSIGVYTTTDRELFLNKTDYTLNVGTGGANGARRTFVPLPVSASGTKFLRDDGTWSTIDVTSVGALDTTSSEALATSSSESLSGTIKLHKISKTGNYNDLLNTPTALKNPNALTISGTGISSAVVYDGSAEKSVTISITKSTIGLGNVDNESKATMFTSPEFTGTPTAPTASSGTNTTQIATTAFVANEIESKFKASKAMVLKGTLGDGGTITALPTTYKTGWTYLIATAGTYAGNVCEVGDSITALIDRDGSGNLDSDWYVTQGNKDGIAIVDTSVVAGSGKIAIFDSTNKYILKSISYGTSGANTIVQRDSSGEISGTSAILAIADSATAKANATASPKVYLNLVQNDKVRSSGSITGSGNVSVASDASGNITITGTQYSHPNSYTAGTYFACTVNTMGHVTSGSTTLDFGEI